jgi:acetyltransferase-like isoleucine patch superfamily enzyme
MNIEGLIIEDSGENNTINIEDGSVFRGCKIMLKGNNNIITLGKALLYKSLVVNFKGNNKQFSVKPSNKNINNVKFTSIRGNNQIFTIGENFSCGGIEVQMNDGDEKFTIGDGGLFSWGIKVRTSDGHSVVDMTTNKAINLPKDVHIGDRVWVSEDVSFLKGAQIPADCVVGSRAVVTKAFSQSNCVIAGFPAKVVKENIRWDRRMPTEFNNQ